MRILHIGDVAGVPQILAKALKKKGHESDVLSFQKHPFNYGVDYCFPTISKFPIKQIKRMSVFLKFINKYDIYHFHGGTIFPLGIDSLLWKCLGKKWIVHHHGSDIRYKGERLMYSKFADKIIVSTPDLMEWSPNAMWIPNPILLDDFSYVGIENKDKSKQINIVHAPSNRTIKGTEDVIKAVNKLKNEGYKINLILIENMPHNEAIEYYKMADIVIDWINPKFGIYGMFSIECMALGKPVICTVNQNFIDAYFRNLAVINSDPLNLAKNLRILIENGELRKEIGKSGRKYVEDVHDSNKIAEQWLKIYEEL